MRKHNRKIVKNKKSKIKIFAISFFFIVIFLLLSIFVKSLVLEKFIFVNKTDSGDGEITIIDAKNDVFIKYLIDGDTEVDSSEDYGKYKLNSLWKLSEKEVNSESLVSDTIRKTYSIPVFLWKNGMKSNLSFMQLVKSRLVKYEDRKFGNSELINFADKYFSETVDSIEVVDMTGEIGLIGKVSNLIEVMGGKITINSKGYDESLDCVISGKDTRNVSYLNNIFKCEVFDHGDKNEVDLYIKLGSKFAERF